MMSEPRDLHVICIGPSPSRAEALEALVRVVIPSAHATHAAGPIPASGMNELDMAIVDGTSASDEAATAQQEDERVSPGLETVRRLRAAGFAGAILVCTSLPGPTDEADMPDEMTRLGATRVPEPRLASVLAAEVHGALEARKADAGTARLLAQLARTRQLLSAGEIAIGLQHSMNNPLAAILAESQLLEMDTLTAEQREAVVRIVGLCRRMTAIVRRLDGVGGPLGGIAPPPNDP